MALQSRRAVASPALATADDHDIEGPGGAIRPGLWAAPEDWWG